MRQLFLSLLAKADAWPPPVLLWVNLAFASFVGLAHGGALLMMNSHPTPNAQTVESVATISLPLVTLVFLTSSLGLAVPRFRHSVLAFHGIVLLLAAAALYVWGVGLLIYGLPKEPFSWSVGFFTAIVAYAVYAFTRYSLPSRFREWPAIHYAPLVALFLAAVVDLGVIVRFSHDMGAHFGG